MRRMDKQLLAEYEKYIKAKRAGDKTLWRLAKECTFDMPSSHPVVKGEQVQWPREDEDCSGLTADEKTIQKIIQASKQRNAATHANIQRTIRVNGGKGKVSFTNLFSTLLGVTGSVKTSQDEATPMSPEDRHRHLYYSPNTVSSMGLTIVPSGNKGQFDAQLGFDFMALQYTNTTLSEDSDGRFSAVAVSINPSVFKFKIKSDELSVVIKDFVMFATSHSKYSFPNLHTVSLEVKDQHWWTIGKLERLVERLGLNGFSNPEFKLEAFDDVQRNRLRWVDGLYLVKWPPTVKREDVRLMQAPIMHLNPGYYHADALMVRMYAPVRVEMYPTLSDAYRALFKPKTTKLVDSKNAASVLRV